MDEEQLTTPRSRLWRAAAVLFVLINVGGAAMGVAMGQRAHTAEHVVLLILGIGAYTVWRGRPQRKDVPHTGPADQRMEYLQQSVDAIALEVERLGEKQRFSEKLRAERDATLPTKRESDESGRT
jgi:hypothetical protein